MVWMIGVDTGGTFTDVVALNAQTGELRTVKVSSTPADPSRAVLDGVQAFLNLDSNYAAREISFFAHGTTVATNAIIERKGARTGLLITAGTNAVALARMSRQPATQEALNPNFKKPELLIPGKLTREIRQRIAYDGSVLLALNEQDVLSAVGELVAAYGIDSLAICYLFAFMNPSHERRTREIVNREFPFIRVSLSSEILPVIREYRRQSTTTLDAFVGQTLARYLGNLGAGLSNAGVETKQVFIMQSNGGLMSIQVAKSRPVHTLLSGPAAGVIAGSYLSEMTGFKNVVTFDVGGTSTDIATIVGGEIAETIEGSVAGQDCAVPMNDIGTIGAGGGTLARVGSDGRLRVGPESAGADPGPACYRKGGVEPAVTDADLVLGYLDEAGFLGGKVRLDKNASRSAISEKVAKPLGLSLERAAYGIVKIVNSNMEGELRLRLMGRGFDPRNFALVAIGGAGPVHASSVAKDVGIQYVIVPPFPGLGSAMGLLLTDIKHTYQQSFLSVLSHLDRETISGHFTNLTKQAQEEALAEGTSLKDLEITYLLELRYVGQGYELPVVCPNLTFDEDGKKRVRQDFNQLHKRTYGHSADDAEVEVVNFRVDTRAPLKKLRLPELPAANGTPVEHARKAFREVYFEEAGGFVKTPIYERTKMLWGHKLCGPAIIDQTDSTTVVLPGQACEVDRHGNMILSF